MNLLHTTIFGLTAWRVYSSTVLVLLYVALRIRWSRAESRRRAEEQIHVASESNNAPIPSRKRKPTLELTDTQRIDHLYRHVSLQAGEQADLKELTFGRLPQLRVSFVGIEHASGQDFAHIKIELGGATADCGTAVQELGENNFLVPRTTHDDQHCAIHYTCGKSDAVSFLQIKVSKIDAVKRSAAIDVMHVRGRRAA